MNMMTTVGKSAGRAVHGLAASVYGPELPDTLAPVLMCQSCGPVKHRFVAHDLILEAGRFLRWDLVYRCESCAGARVWGSQGGGL
jgi:hypothetical protein